MLSCLLFTCIIITCFRFLLLFYNRKSEIEAKRKQEEEERKKREEEEKRMQVNVLAVWGFFGGGGFLWFGFFWCWVVGFFCLFLFLNLFHSLGSPQSLMASFHKCVSESLSSVALVVNVRRKS